MATDTAASVNSHPVEATIPLPLHADINVDVLIIGAGFSGISTIYRTRKLGLKAVILESGTGFGGVWHHNRYPGARVDSEWPYYQLNIPEVYNTFHFTERFPSDKELRRYMNHVDNVLGLSKDTIFNATVNGCSWNPTKAQWTVKTQQGHTARGKYLVLCSGLLHQRHYPNLPGLTNFKGQIIHSGFWPSNLETKDKKIALVGAGATSVQITQELAKEASKLTIFMRRPSYCLPMTQRPITEAENRSSQMYFDTLFRAGRASVTGFPVPPATKSLALDSPESREKILTDCWSRGGFQFLTHYTDVHMNIESSKIAYEFWSRKTRERMRPGKKRDIVAPTVEKMPYLFGTKRTPLEQDYYEMIDRDEVDVVDMNESKIRGFTEGGLEYEDGEKLDFDLLVLATGFDSFSGSVTNMNLKNIHGIDIKEIWAKEGIKSYLGMTFATFPNMFMVYSPHAPINVTNGPTVIEAQSDLIVSLISNLESSHVRTLTPLASAQEEWTDVVDRMGRQTLYPLTGSWWNGGNIPGKKAQCLTYTDGIAEYERVCRGFMMLDGKQRGMGMGIEMEMGGGLKGFEVVYEEVEVEIKDVVATGMGTGASTGKDNVLVSVGEVCGEECRVKDVSSTLDTDRGCVRCAVVSQGGQTIRSNA